MLLLLFPQGGSTSTGIDINAVVDSILPSLGASSLSDLDWCTQAELLQWADDAAKRLAATAGVFVEYDANTTTATGQASYSTPTGHIDMIKAAVGNNLRAITVAELNALDATWQATPGAPKRFSMDANAPNNLTLYPVPIATDAVALLFHKFPDAITVNNHSLSAPRPIRGYFAAFLKAEARRKESDATMTEMADHFSARVAMFERVLEHLYGPSN
jgi:hypothetical protein